MAKLGIGESMFMAFIERIHGYMDFNIRDIVCLKKEVKEGLENKWYSISMVVFI